MTTPPSRAPRADAAARHERLIALHRLSRHHLGDIRASNQCSCFSCLARFAPDEITHWTDRQWNDDPRATAFCPRCGADSVLPDTPEHPLDDVTLRAMQHRWF